MIAALSIALQAPATRIPAEPPIGGPIWTIVVPAMLFIVAFGATYLLYRKFKEQ
jgi:hypothetical protein